MHPFKGKVNISIKISLKIVPNGPINNMPQFVHIMAQCRNWQHTIIWTNDGRVYGQMIPSVIYSAPTS